MVISNLINKREYLLSIPVKYLYNLCKEYKISKYRKLAKWSLVTLLLKQKDIKKNIYELISNVIYFKNLYFE